MNLNLKLKYKVIDLNELSQHLNIEKNLAVDFETDGFYGEILTAQFYQKDWPEVLIVKKPIVNDLINILTTVKIIAHNVCYEVSTLQANTKEKFVIENWDDTLLLSKLHYYTKEKFDLASCYSYLHGVDIYAIYDLDKKELQKSFKDELTDKQLTYAALDVFHLIELYDVVKAAKGPAYKVLKAATDVGLDFQKNGLPINRKKILGAIDLNTLKADIIDLPINVNSWQQVRPYIGEEESDALALQTFALEGNTKAGDVLTTRKLLKQNSFLNKYINESIDDRIYGRFTFTTKSGRGTCSKQNLQQLPRATKVMFNSNKVFVISDFSQLELRLACALIGDNNMYKAFMDGVDLHQYTADLMDVPRQQAKTCNFNLLYGGSAKMLQSIFIREGKLIPLKDVQTLKNKWHNIYPQITAWQTKTINNWRKGNKVQQTILGRKFTSKLYTDAMNLPVQGNASDIAKLALIRINKLGYKICNFVHDSYILEVDDKPEIYENLCELITDCMQSAWFDIIKYTKFKDLKMPVNVLVGKNWGDLDYGTETPIFNYNKD